ncbi:TetR/AcrR family transcriptional regulator [Yinghuangia soli]|uniref:TetR family transcriptional regulator C-terminal domain-containing protein n=1 Tax=Yinghuangia soli TaxID=2908204 RepID=A0AA41PY78_9ACTN|nr:TetR family transcriptional regulator C-terminal domain-containing protein [Yinghuangia soli]MCF2527876.1 TetR family transcriptional regulator C-terminal domain-containing protein [Yinghuangia soli]
MPPPARRKRLEQPREVVLQAALDAIAESGLDAMTMAALGKRLGISGGHILYYFGSKDRLLVETLRWSEELLGERRRELLAGPAPAAERLAGYVDLYLPVGRADPRWTIWVAVYGRSLGDAEVLQAGHDIERVWAAELDALLVEGADAGEWPATDAAARRDFAVRLHGMLDGFALQIVIGAPGVVRADRLAHALAYVHSELTPTR